jgi:hypothetical protein
MICAAANIVILATYIFRKSAGVPYQVGEVGGAAGQPALKVLPPIVLF